MNNKSPNQAAVAFIRATFKVCELDETFLCEDEIPLATVQNQQLAVVSVGCMNKITVNIGNMA